MEAHRRKGGVNRRSAPRAPFACSLCRSRKVRCIVTREDLPCVNCERDGIDCHLVSKRHGVYKSIRHPQGTQIQRNRQSRPSSSDGCRRNNKPLGRASWSPGSCLEKSTDGASSSLHSRQCSGTLCEYANSLATSLEILDRVQIGGSLETLHRSMLESMVTSIQQISACRRTSPSSPDGRPPTYAASTTWSFKQSPHQDIQLPDHGDGSPAPRRSPQDHPGAADYTSDRDDENDSFGGSEINDMHSRASPESPAALDGSIFCSWFSDAVVPAGLDKATLQKRSLLVGYAYSRSGPRSVYSLDSNRQVR
ncbi:Fungal Zn2-Cys6 binuclear cluster domain-containing protein [Cladophialophora immunda]|nr:Fungal Zn2-Cys6 binuclear cluster domain-containing protein [Cladophialophora immunda]